MTPAEYKRKIEGRNRREIIVAGGLVVFILATEPMTWRSVPLFAAIAWVAYFILVHANWQALSEGREDVRREVRRQGRLLRWAWAWYVAPVLAGALISWRVAGVALAAFAAFGILLSALNYFGGKKLEREAR